ncbi:DNA double-strand break repair nuclease NurA [Candidatus Thorarchaeota archaeon]|nr:MAG: DNA double-strand break repair nuclease NurA [Candidatus Thorarchaeota archaeon]
MDRNLDKMLSRLVEEIERVEVTRRDFGGVLTDIKQQIDLGKFPAIAAEIPERRLTKSITPVNLSGLSIAGIDGGLVRRRFRSMDLIMTRGVAVIFEFGPKEGPTVRFFPEPFPEPMVKPVMLTLSGPELEQISSLERIATEIRVALAVLDEFHTDIVLLDGSLLYHPRDRPQLSSPAYDKFQEVMALYRQLYNKAKAGGVALVGIVKDSRSMRVANILGEILPHVLRDPEIFEKMQGIDYRWLLKNSRDCDILDTFLEEGERSFAFKYSSEILSSNSVKNELKKWVTSIWVTYLKTASEDLPLRVEMLLYGDLGLEPEKLDRALAAILPLSWQHPEYGMPTPILEADTRARISMNETRMVVDRLMALSGLTYTKLEQRRSRNPFGG